MIDFEQLIRLLMAAAMVAGAGLGLWLLTAWTRRLARGGRTDISDTGAWRAETADLRDQVQRLTSDVAELHERVDFTERLLARQRDAERLKG
jgi:hypothetical protein